MSVHASVCVSKILLSCASHVPSVIVSMFFSVLVYSWSSPATWGHGHGGSGQAQINVEGCVRERKIRREGREKMEAVL